MHLKTPLVWNVSMDYCLSPLDLPDLLRSRFCLSISTALSQVVLRVRQPKWEALCVSRRVLASGGILGAAGIFFIPCC